MAEEGDGTTVLRDDIRTLQVPRSLQPSAISTPCHSDREMLHMQAHISSMNTGSVESQTSEVHGVHCVNCAGYAFF